MCTKSYLFDIVHASFEGKIVDQQNGIVSRPRACSNGILPTPPSYTSPRSDDGILPTPPFYTRLPSTYSLRRSGSSPTRSGLPQKASSTPVPRSSPSTLGVHPLPFSPLPSPHLFHLLLISLLSSRLFLFLLPSEAPLPARASRVTSLSSSAQWSSRTVSVPCPFLADIACHYVSLCRSLISPSPSLHFPVATGEST